MSPCATLGRGGLCPFDYYGVPDEVDYANIPWRSHRFDEEALTVAVATRARAENALELQDAGAPRHAGGGRASPAHGRVVTRGPLPEPSMCVVGGPTGGLSGFGSG
jgi:hypothetical protein